MVKRNRSTYHIRSIFLFLIFCPASILVGFIGLHVFRFGFTSHIAVALPFFDAIEGTTSRLGKTYKKETAVAVLALCRRQRMDVVVLPIKKVMVVGGKPVQRRLWSLEPTGSGTKCKQKFPIGRTCP